MKFVISLILALLPLSSSFSITLNCSLEDDCSSELTTLLSDMSNDLIPHEPIIMNFGSGNHTLNLCFDGEKCESYPIAPGVRLPSIKLIGESWDASTGIKSKITTNGLHLKQFFDVEFKNILIEGSSSLYKHKRNLVYVGVNQSCTHRCTKNFKMYRSMIRNSYKGMLALVGIDHISIDQSTFSKAGVGGVRNTDEGHENQEHYLGNSIYLNNLKSGVIINNYFTHILRAGVMMEDTENIDIIYNTFRLRHNVPTVSYEYRGAGCLYQGEKNKNTVFSYNQCFEYYINGVRLYGDSTEISYNHFNHEMTDTACTINNYNAYEPKKIAIKVHTANSSSKIIGNCIFNASSGIYLDSTVKNGNIGAIFVDSNKIRASGECIKEVGVNSATISNNSCS